jgi:hypothetical protein
MGGGYASGRHGRRISRVLHEASRQDRNSERGESDLDRGCSELKRDMRVWGWEEGMESGRVYRRISSGSGHFAVGHLSNTSNENRRDNRVPTYL